MTVFYAINNIWLNINNRHLLQVRQTRMQVVASSTFPEVDISEEIEQETGSVRTLTVSVGTQTDASEQRTEEGGNKQYICKSSLTDAILRPLLY